MELKDVMRAQLLMSYRLGYMAYMRDDEWGLLPAYMNDLGDALQKLGVDIMDVQLDVAENLTRGY